MKLIKVFFIFFVFTATGLLIFMQNNAVNPEVKYIEQDLDSTSWAGDITAEEKGTGAKEREVLNVLIAGVDGDGYRTDIIMLFNYRPGSPDLNILSLERDARIQYKGKHMKLNAVYAAGGIEGLKNLIEKITGLETDNYAVIDFKGFREVVDVFGGVDFYVPFNMKYDDPVQNLHINLKKGMQRLDGKKAEQLVRYRKGNRKGSGYIDGDIGRIKMQQDFVKAFIEQKAKIKYISKVDDLYSIIKESVKTDIDFRTITAYIGSVIKIKPEEIKTYTLPGESILRDGAWYFIIDRGETEELIGNNFYKD
jgi:LCP family protein required for cell wall assembly